MLVLVDGSHLLGLVLIQELDPVGDALKEKKPRLCKAWSPRPKA